MPSRLLAVAFEARDPVRLMRFWADLLGRLPVEESGGVLLPGDGTQAGLLFVSGRAERTGPNRLHLHLTSDSETHQRQTVAAALRLGAHHLDVGQRPEEGHVVLADPEGNALCVIEPGNAYLAGCGFLGEVACDGSRATGLFWSKALRWPLVWDEGEETAIQSPLGGTKVAWSGVPGTETGQRFVLLPDGDRAAEAERLVSLGATARPAGDGGVAVLADPDGIGFLLSAREGSRTPTPEGTGT